MDDFTYHSTKNALFEGLPTITTSIGETLHEVWPFSLTQIAWCRDKIDQVKIAQTFGSERLPMAMTDGAIATSNGTLLPLMQGRVLYCSQTGLNEEQIKSLSNLGVYWLDLTEGRVVLNLSGADWAWILMKGCGLDFENMKPGSTAQTTLFKISTLIWITQTTEVRLIVPYTLARSLVERLLDAGAFLSSNPNLRNRT